MRAALALLAVLALTGCSVLEEKPAWRATEATFHALNWIDMHQSIQDISHGCWEEGDEITRAAIGTKPTSGEFVAWGLLVSTTFHLINRTEFMQEHPKWRAVFDGAAIASRVYIVADNARMGHRCAP